MLFCDWLKISIRRAPAAIFARTFTEPLFTIVDAASQCHGA